MAILTEQLELQKNLSLDIRLQPLADIASLGTYSYYAYAHDGMEVTVLNSGKPIIFKIVSGGATSLKKYHWHINSVLKTDSFASLTELSQTIVSTLSTAKNISNAFEIGVKAVVLNDETNDNKWNEYIVTSIENGIPTWSRAHFDVSKLSLSVDSENDSVAITYDNVAVGSAATLTEILQSWQVDKFIVSGSVITENEKEFIEFYYNDETADPIRVEITGKGGKNDTILSAETYTGAVELATEENLTRIILVNSDEVIVTGTATSETYYWKEFDYETLDENTVDVIHEYRDGTSDILNVTNWLVSDNVEDYNPNLDENKGKYFYLKAEDKAYISTNEYETTDTCLSGLYVVNGVGSVRKLGISLATVDLGEDVADLKERVETLETEEGNLHWRSDVDTVTEHEVRFWRGPRATYEFLRSLNMLSEWTHYSVIEDDDTIVEYLGTNRIEQETGQLRPVLSVLEEAPENPSANDRYLIGKDGEGYEVYTYYLSSENVLNVEKVTFDDRYAVRVKDRSLKNYIYEGGELKTYDDINCGTF